MPKIFIYLVGLHDAGLPLPHQLVVQGHDVLEGVQTLAPLIVAQLPGLLVEPLPHTPRVPAQPQDVPVVEDAVEDGDGAARVVQVAAQLREVVHAGRHLVLRHTRHPRLGIARLGREQEDEGEGGLGDEAQEVGLEAEHVHHLECGSHAELVTQRGQNLGVGLKRRPPLGRNLGLHRARSHGVS